MVFKDARIAILEARMGSEMADLIRRNGGNVFSAPAVRESAVASEQPVSAFIDHLTAGTIQAVAFFTGVGVSSLCKEAERLERLPELLTALHKVTVICRGPKPSAVLRRYGVPIALIAREPFTTQELLEVMESLDIKGMNIGVVHYGERNDVIAQTLRARGAELEELCLYEWLMPDDVGPLKTLLKDLFAQQIDAVVFTSQVQVRHLFLIAEELGLRDELVVALNTRTIVASVGPTCTGVLESYGITPHVIPEHPKMGHLVKALVTYMTP